MGSQQFYSRGSRAIVGSVVEEFEGERDRVQEGFQRVWDNVFKGRAFFVDAVNGSDLQGGQSWNTAVATITRALALVESGRCDRIYVAPGTYAENVVVTKDGVEIIGFCPGGYDRPDVVGVAGIPLSVHAQGFVCQHIRFASPGAFHAVVQQGNGFLYSDCVFDGDGLDGLNLLPDLDDDSFTASEGKVVGCLHRGATGAGLRFTNPGPGVEGGVGPTDVEVRRCRFYDNGVDIKDTDTAGSNDTTFLNCLVEDCDFLTDGGGAFVYVNLAAGGANKGTVAGCRFNETALVAGQVLAPVPVRLVGCFDATGVIDASAF